MPRGRKPKPTEQKRLAGNPGKRKLPENELQFEPIEAVDAPEHLDEIATECWNAYAPLLCGQKVLCVTDLHHLEIFCCAYSGYRQSIAEAGKQITIMQENGTLKKNPALSAANEFAGQMRSHGALLGLSPADRSRIMTPPKKKEEGGLGKIMEMMS